jgi:hypothetical protein
LRFVGEKCWRPNLPAEVDVRVHVTIHAPVFVGQCHLVSDTPLRGIGWGVAWLRPRTIVPMENVRGQGGDKRFRECDRYKGWLNM